VQNDPDSFWETWIGPVRDEGFCILFDIPIKAGPEGITIRIDKTEYPSDNDVRFGPRTI
jgi:hypothetical protein